METIEVFTDGSFMKKGGKKLCGYGIHFPNGEIQDISRKFTRDPLTNQRAELFAIYVALILIKKVLEFKKIIIYTDSEYSIKSCTIWIRQWEKNGWKTAAGQKVKNQDILIPISDIINKIIMTDKEIKFVHVKSHTGKKDKLSIGNDIVDKLANNGARKTNNI